MVPIRSMASRPAISLCSPSSAPASEARTRRGDDHPEAGCTLAALSGDAGRQGPEVQATFAQGLREVLSLAAGVLAGRGGRRKPARDEAVRTYSEIVGALVLSRAVKDVDPALSEEILTASRKALG